MSKTHRISGSSLTKIYSNRRHLFGSEESFIALEDVSFNLGQGESLCILGEAGSGKSTLAKILVGSVEPTSGLLVIDNKDVTSLSKSSHFERNRRIRMVYQNTLDSLNPSLTLGRIIEEPLINMTHLDATERRDYILSTLEKVGLKEEHMERLPHTFSAGERQRIAIARALILDPICIIADEPLSALETSAQSQIVNLMLDIQKAMKLSYIIISYNFDFIRHICDKVLVLCRGRTVEYGPTEEVLNHPSHPYTKTLLSLQGLVRSNTKQQRFRKINESGCVFSDRCKNFQPRCAERRPDEQLRSKTLVRCFFPLTH